MSCSEELVVYCFMHGLYFSLIKPVLFYNNKGASLKENNVLNGKASGKANLTKICLHCKRVDMWTVTLGQSMSTVKKLSDCCGSFYMVKCLVL